MSWRSPWVRAGIVAAVTGLFGAACGATGDPETEVGSAGLSCESDRDEILELLRTGLPTYDYEPASDLATLIERTDVVLTGAIETIGRAVGEPDPGLGSDGWTVVTVRAPEVLHAAGEVDGPLDEFSYTAGWPTGAGPDPLANAVGIEGMTFMAFLERSESAPGGAVPHVQGLVVACADDTDPTSVIEPLPIDAAGVPLADLATEVGAASEASRRALGSGVDGPLLRHVAPEALEGEGAEIVGTLELQDGCLYLRSTDDAERYPIVWPNRTRWDGAREVVVLPNGDEVGMTDAVAGGGGYHDVAGVEAAAGPDAAATAERCLDNPHGEIAVVNNHAGAIGRADPPDEGDAQPDGSTALSVEPGTPLGELQTEPAPGEVRLWVSNQSFADDPIHLTVAIGEVIVVDQRFETQGQHNWMAFDIAGLEPGTHTISAESETGASLTADFTVPTEAPRWLLLDYWYDSEEGGSRRFTFGEYDHALAFA